MKNEMELSASLANLPASWQGMGPECPLSQAWVGAGWVMAKVLGGFWELRFGNGKDRTWVSA